jgi:hypothetical protein
MQRPVIDNTKRRKRAGISLHPEAGARAIRGDRLPTAHRGGVRGDNSTPRFSLTCDTKREMGALVAIRASAEFSDECEGPGVGSDEGRKTNVGRTSKKELLHMKK